MQPTEQRAWRAGRFWWDRPQPSEATVRPPLRALIFDLDAIADIECSAHLPAFNAAFAANGVEIEWTVARYRQLLALSDERRRVAAELRRRGVSAECDVLAELLADQVCAAKNKLLDETILDADIAPRCGLVDLITDAFSAGIAIGVVSGGRHAWVEPLVRQLVGEGIVSTVVTASDVRESDVYRAALADLGASPRDALAFAGSEASQRRATAAGLATVLIDGDDTVGAPLRVAECQRLHNKWQQPPRAA
ncbi:MAG: HAD hydrolase-like protein [Actinomycetia bacterium]|nr:HAD hydrolase-like protein [Actinomycetes bacterium]MCH9701987.1 HAD hydrolase-like protein [Actinomycetes bacterium]MCH9761331.1 HAD hydrolase-like protein [Actinomycetes bacterium]